MLFQKSHYLKLLIATMITSSVFSQNIPQPIQNLYQSKVDSSISDEFNNNRTDNSVDLTKWNYRRTKNSGPSTKYVKEQFGYVSCKGIKADKRAGGIVTKKFKKYGFYAVKWRALGIASNKRSAWHPSIWSAVGNGQLEGTKAKKQVPNIGKGWLEIDMIEFENFSTTNTYWSSDAPARVPSPNPNGKLIKVNDAEGIKLGYKKAVMIPKVTSGFASWQTHGLEYTPTYLQMWKITNKGWSKQGKKIVFNNNNPSTGSIPLDSRSALFWYIGNLFLDQNPNKIKDNQITDSSFDVDWFRYYPYKASKNLLAVQAEEGNVLSSISPNPTKSNTSITYNIATNSNVVELLIYDLNGKIITSQIQSNLNAGNHTTVIDVSGLSPNMYLCKLIIDGKETNAEKLIVN